MSTSTLDTSVKPTISIPPRRRAPTVPAPTTLVSPQVSSPLSAISAASPVNPAVGPVTAAITMSRTTDAHSTEPTAPPDTWSPPNTICPPGLQCLMPLDQLFMDQEIETLEVLTGWQIAKKYNIMDTKGKHVFSAYEDSSDLARICLGRYRSCEFRVVDANMKEVLRLSRPLKCESCCYPCCMQEVSVRSNGMFLGSVVQNWNLWRYSFSVCNEIGETVLRIKGPIFWCAFGNDFEIRSMDERHRIGVISRKSTGLVRQLFEYKDIFGLSFPQNLDVKIKAVLLAACFLIDFMYYEENSRLKHLSNDVS